MQQTKIGDWVLEKNNQFIVFNKPPGIAVQPDSSEEKSLIELAEIYTKKKLLLVHRIDRPASGLVVFAKTDNAAKHLSAQFKERKINKVYLAVVKHEPPAIKGTLTHYLKKIAKLNKSIALDTEEEDTKKSMMNYEVIAQSEHYQLLKVVLATGRHHQIRAQLAAVNCPIKGDVKYGFKRGNPDRSIHLHAWQLSFIHPTTKQVLSLQADLPKEALWQSFDLENHQ